MLVGEKNPSKHEHDGIGPPSVAQLEELSFRVAQAASEVEFHELPSLPNRPRRRLGGNVGRPVITALPYKYCLTKMGKPKWANPPPEVISNKKNARLLLRLVG